jgi:hypothetical protein
VGFSEATGGRALSFRDVSMGETAALSLSRGMRRGQNSPVDTLLKRLSPDPWIGKLKKSPPSLENYGLYKALYTLYLQKTYNIPIYYFNHKATMHIHKKRQDHIDPAFFVSKIVLRIAFFNHLPNH